MEQTLILLKPDAVARGIAGEIIARFERVGLRLAAMKMLSASREQLEAHYLKDDDWLIEKGKSIIKNKNYPENYDPKKAGMEIVEGLIKDIMLSPILALVLEGHNAVAVARKLTGPTNIEEAPPGTIRGDYSHDTYNLANMSNRPIITVIHASGTAEEARKEISIWFTPAEIHNYKRTDTDLHYRRG